MLKLGVKLEPKLEPGVLETKVLGLGGLGIDVLVGTGLTIGTKDEIGPTADPGGATGIDDEVGGVK